MQTHTDLVMVIAINLSSPKKDGFYSSLNMAEITDMLKNMQKEFEKFTWISRFVDLNQNHYY